MADFELNIAKVEPSRVSRFSDGACHYARVALGNAATEEQAREQYAEFAKRFPFADGWRLTLSRWERSGRDIITQHSHETIAARAAEQTA